MYQQTHHGGDGDAPRAGISNDDLDALPALMLTRGLGLGRYSLCHKLHYIFFKFEWDS